VLAITVVCTSIYRPTNRPRQVIGKQRSRDVCTKLNSFEVSMFYFSIPFPLMISPSPPCEYLRHLFTTDPGPLAYQVIYTVSRFGENLTFEHSQSLVLTRVTDRWTEKCCQSGRNRQVYYYIALAKRLCQNILTTN